MLDGAEGAHGQHEDGGDEGKDSGDGKTDDAEGQQDEPDERIEDERGEGKRPADHDKYAEEKKVEHDVVSLVRRGWYVGRLGRVPWGEELLLKQPAGRMRRPGLLKVIDEVSGECALAFFSGCAEVGTVIGGNVVGVFEAQLGAEGDGAAEPEGGG